MLDVLERPALLMALLLVGAVAVVVTVVVMATRSGRNPGNTPPGPGSFLPGWYPQPDGTQRFWDGTGWTGDVR